MYSKVPNKHGVQMTVQCRGELILKFDKRGGPNNHVEISQNVINV